ncbi:MAG: NAD-dependent epimerase/dehydratase family protein, partial [Christensenellales bacterium]
MITVALTGASGSMGSEALKQLLELDDLKLKILLRPKKSNLLLGKRLLKKYKNRLEVIFGDLSEYKDCELLIKDVDYVLHCGAIIPPKSDHQPSSTYNSNFIGTKNLVDAVLNSGRADEIKFVYIGTVALYGNRDYHHPWGRVGDPLMPSTY